MYSSKSGSATLENEIKDFRVGKLSDGLFILNNCRADDIGLMLYRRLYHTGASEFIDGCFNYSITHLYFGLFKVEVNLNDVVTGSCVEIYRGVFEEGGCGAIGEMYIQSHTSGVWGKAFVSSCINLRNHLTTLVSEELYQLKQKYEYEKSVDKVALENITKLFTDKKDK